MLFPSSPAMIDNQLFHSNILVHECPDGGMLGFNCRCGLNAVQIRDMISIIMTDGLGFRLLYGLQAVLRLSDNCHIWIISRMAHEVLAGPSHARPPARLRQCVVVAF
jgi:hypothetical protein